MARLCRRRGVSLIEIMIATAVLVLGLVGLLASMMYATRSNMVNKESTQAMQACQRVIETLYLTKFEDIFRTYNANPADDLGAAGSAPGCNFDILDNGSITFTPPGAGQFRMFPAATTDADGRVGRIEFPQNGNLLVETQLNNLNNLGNRDLNSDGVTDPATTDHATDYDILPVAVTIEWNGTGGNRIVRYQTILVKR
jgi:type II secretory pathway pseudopilin PulG